VVQLNGNSDRSLEQFGLGNCGKRAVIIRRGCFIVHVNLGIKKGNNFLGCWLFGFRIAYFHFDRHGVCNFLNDLKIVGILAASLVQNLKRIVRDVWEESTLEHSHNFGIHLFVFTNRLRKSVANSGNTFDK
jgi:hypothetical protein